jgi:integrase
VSQYPTKGAAWKAVQEHRDTGENLSKPVNIDTAQVSTLVEQYRVEKMPQRFSTRHGYNAWLSNHIVPKWGNCSIIEVQARPVELWLHSLPLAPKSRAAIRGLLGILWDFAMWRGDVPTQRNPMELVTIKGATKRTHQPRSLTVEEFQRFVQHLEEPFRTMALVCVCLGLRISECLALKWVDVDWLNGKLRVERGIVRQHVGEVKTAESRKHLSINCDLSEVLKQWKQTTQFSAPDDWVFASPVKLGRLPWSYPSVWLVFQKAARDAGIGKLGTHAMRHSYRSWLDAVGTPIAVQQKLMRHADIRTTLNVYGDVVTDEMAQAAAKVAGLALSRA